MKIRIFALILLSALTTTANAESWLCVADQTTGFAFKDGKWISGEFDTSEAKHIIRPLQEGDFGYGQQDFTHGVFVPEKPGNIQWCRKADGEEFYLRCRGFGELHYSNKTGRYLKTYPFGYVKGDDIGGADTPHIEIGRCSEL